MSNIVEKIANIIVNRNDTINLGEKLGAQGVAKEILEALNIIVLPKDAEPMEGIW